MLKITFGIAGETQYARRFDALASEMDDLSDPLAEVRDRLVQTVGQQFQDEGSHGTAGGWDALSDAYARWKADAFPGRPMLVLSGAMRQAFLVDGTIELTARRLVWGVDDQVDQDGVAIVDRALAHQQGQGPMPERKIVALREDDQRAFDRAFVNHIQHLRHRLFA